MFKIKQIWVICRNSIFCTIFNCKIYVALILVSILFQQLVGPIKDFSKLVGIKVNGWVFPFLTEYSFVQVAVVLAVAFIFCDIPFDDEASEWMLLRAGRQNWIFGKVLYIILMSGIMTFLFFLVSIILLIPQLQLCTGWGKVLGTLAQTNAANVMGLNIVKLDYNLQISCEPLQACIYSMLMVWLVLSMAGMLILVCNLLFKKGIGQIVGIGFAFLAFLAPNFSNMYKAYYFSPSSWFNISLFTTGEYSKFPSLSYMISFILISDIVLLVGSVLLSKKYEILTHR